MKLVFIYGPPAVGKLTVAENLSRITGYPIFHNHHTVDLALSLFPFDSDGFTKLSSELRFKTFEMAMQYGLEGLIFTYWYNYPEDNWFIDQVRIIIKSGGGTIHFAQLQCSREELENRVVSSSRFQFKKLQTKQELKRVLDQCDSNTPIPDSSSLSINNTQLEPDRVAELIVSHFNFLEKNKNEKKSKRFIK